MIEMFHVYKTYQKDTPALNDVSLKIDKGEFVFVTGPSGAGKTTLLKLLFAAERVTEGQILVFGKNITNYKESQIPILRRKIGVVFQDFKLLMDRTVFDNIAYTLEVIGQAKRDIERRVNSVLKLVSLAHRAKHIARKLSGGEQQRVSIARALVNDPSILLADEPTGNLDWKLTVEIMNFFQDINARGTTIVIATHNSNLLKMFNKRIITLEKGRLG